MTKGMTKPTHGYPPEHDGLPIGSEGSSSTGRSPPRPSPDR